MSQRRPLQWSMGAAGPVIAALAVDGDAVDGDRGWMDNARCAEADPDAFYPETGGSTKTAKKVCMACEVRAECLEYALEHEEKFGVWGGKSELQRKKLRRERRERAA